MSEEMKAKFSLVEVLGEVDATQYVKHKATILVAKTLEKIIDPMDKRIKAALRALGTNDTIEDSGFTFKYGTQNRSTMDDVKLIELLKQKGLTDAIKTIEVSDSEAVTTYLKSNQLTLEELDTCKVPNIIDTLTVKYVITPVEEVPEKKVGAKMF